MDVYEAIRKRRSIRGYLPDKVPQEVLDRLLEAVRAAPSACNHQPWRFVVVREEATRKRLAQACHGQGFIAQAPVVIVACGWQKDAYPRMGGYWNSLPVDVAIALDHLMLAAASEGLGTCWIGSFDEKEVREVLGIPEDVTVIGATPLGYSSGPSGTDQRKPLSEIVCEEHW